MSYSLAYTAVAFFCLSCPQLYNTERLMGRSLIRTELLIRPVLTIYWHRAIWLIENPLYYTSWQDSPVWSHFTLNFCACLELYFRTMAVTFMMSTGKTWAGSLILGKTSLTIGSNSFAQSLQTTKSSQVQIKQKSIQFQSEGQHTQEEEAENAFKRGWYKKLCSFKRKSGTSLFKLKFQ